MPRANTAFRRIGSTPGHYAISIRAVGYDLDGPKAVDIAAGGSKADLKLVKTKNLANQLSNAEWLMSAPGPDNLKGNMTNCVGCHTLQRVFSSVHYRRGVQADLQADGELFAGQHAEPPASPLAGSAGRPLADAAVSV